MNEQILSVCHLTSMHNWQDDRIFQRACVGLARKNHHVHLIAVADSDDEVGSMNSHGVNVIVLSPRKGIKRRIFGSKAVISAAMKVEADVFQFHDPDLLPFIGRLRRSKPNSAIVYDIHENYAGRFSNWGLPAFLGTWFRNYETRVINKLSGITVVSNSMKSLFERVKVPIEITRNSTDIERLKDLDLADLQKSDTPIVITSGSHSHARNCLQTVKAMPFTKEVQGQKPVFQFVGRYLGGIEQELKEQAEKDGVIAQLRLDGMAPWEKNFTRIAKASCGCVFYEDNANNRVGIPNRLFEYMFCQIPVIVSNFPELKAVVESAECGVVVDSESPEDIANGINAILQDPELATKMGLNGRRAMEQKFGYHVDLENLISFYKKILS